MATGIILSINPDGASGTVQVDETGEVLPFNDAKFSSSGLAVGDRCTFNVLMDLSTGLFYAASIQPLASVPPPKTITDAFNGDVTVNVGEVVTITGPAAVVTGNIIINGGKVIVEQNAVVTGKTHSVIDGVLVARKGGQVKGGINIDGGGSMKIVNKGKVTGGINIQSAGRLIVGNDNGPGFITGSIDILKIRKVTITADSSINCV